MYLTIVFYTPTGRSRIPRGKDRWYAYALWELYHVTADILIRQNNKPLNNIAL
jgi:hypothetical protein